MTKHAAPDHKLTNDGTVWVCSCGDWSKKVPPIRGYGDTTAEARSAQLLFAHGNHIRHAAAKSKAHKGNPIDAMLKRGDES